MSDRKPEELSIGLEWHFDGKTHGFFKGHWGEMLVVDGKVDDKVRVRIFETGVWFRYDHEFKMIESGRSRNIKEAMEKFDG